MKIVVTKIGVEFEGKIDLGSWNSVKISQTRWADIVADDGEDVTPEMVNAASEALFNDVRGQVRKWAGEAKPKKDAPEMALKVARQFAGKPIVNGDDDSLINPILLSDK
jgi:hypothetical protein